MIDYPELGRRLNFIKTLYCQYKIDIKPGQGLSEILIEAENILNGVKIPEDDENIKFSVTAFHYTWSLAETLETCANAGWNVSNHLKQITTGTVNYGEPASGNETKKIFYKDFECELFIGSALIKKGLKPELLDNPDDPKGDMKLEDIFIEVKHPNSKGQITKLMQKFNNEMRINNSFGIFIMGIEDMFNMGDAFQFNDLAHFNTWKTQKNREIEQFGTNDVIPIAKTLVRIIGLAQTSTQVYDILGATDLKRLGNSILLDRNGIPSETQNNAQSILKSFNPTPSVLKIAHPIS